MSTSTVTAPTDIDHDTTTERRRAAALAVAEGIAAGLPVPLMIYFAVDGHTMSMRLDDERPADVDQWARHLGFPPATLSDRVTASEKVRCWRNYRSAAEYGAWHGLYRAEVESYQHLGDPKAAPAGQLEVGDMVATHTEWPDVLMSPTAYEAGGDERGVAWHPVTDVVVGADRIVKVTVDGLDEPLTVAAGNEVVARTGRVETTAVA